MREYEVPASIDLPVEGNLAEGDLIVVAGHGRLLHDDRVRVLQLCGRPSWDERFLRRLLKRNPNVDLISFFILRTPSDLAAVDSDELSLIPFPTHELFQNELPSFDVIFLQNFEYMPYGIGAYLDNIRQYVETGGGMAMIGGALASFLTACWAGILA